MEKIQDYLAILESRERVLNIIKTELLEIKDKYADERSTKIHISAIEYNEDGSLIPEEDVMIVLTNKGYIKRTTTDTFKVQNNGGIEVKGVTTNYKDFVEQLINLLTHDYIMFFANKGKVYRLKGYEVPELIESKGLPIIYLLQIEKDEKINV